MSVKIQRDIPPLRQDSSGAWRVGQSRVLLELVIRAFQDGATAETIVQRYAAISLADVYAVIAYYLRHREAIEAYLEEREELAAEIRQRIEDRQGDISDLRRRLLMQQSP